MLTEFSEQFLQKQSLSFRFSDNNNLQAKDSVMLLPAFCFKA